MTSMRKRIKVNPGDRILIDNLSAPQSRYSIEAPNVWHGWGFARDVMQEAGIPPLPDDVVVLIDDSPLNLRRAAQELATYFQRQFSYDFLQFNANRPEGSVVFLWSVEAGRTERLAFGAVHFVRHQTGWTMNWAWFHPYLRRKGHLTSVWPYFRERFGRFALEPLLSRDMKEFLARVGYPDSGTTSGAGVASGDWDVHHAALAAVRVPSRWKFSEEATETTSEEEPEEAGDFYNWLVDQLERDDPVGDVAQMAYADAEWPRTGGIDAVWEALLRKGFCYEGRDCLWQAWREFNDEAAVIGEDVHRQLADEAFKLEADLSRVSTLLGEHPHASSFRKMRTQVEGIRHEMIREARRAGVDTDIYLVPPEHRDQEDKE